MARAAARRHGRPRTSSAPPTAPSKIFARRPFQRAPSRRLQALSRRLMCVRLPEISRKSHSHQISRISLLARSSRLSSRATCQPHKSLHRHSYKITPPRRAAISRKSPGDTARSRSRTHRSSQISPFSTARRLLYYKHPTTNSQCLLRPSPTQTATSSTATTCSSSASHPCSLRDRRRRSPSRRRRSAPKPAKKSKTKPAKASSTVDMSLDVDELLAEPTTNMTSNIDKIGAPVRHLRAGVELQLRRVLVRHRRAAHVLIRRPRDVAPW